MRNVKANGRMVPAAALITGTAKAENRGSFLSFNSAVQQLAAGIASFIAGLILVEGGGGVLLNFNIVGYLAIFFSLLCIPLARRIKVVDTDEPSVNIEFPESLEVEKTA